MESPRPGAPARDTGLPPGVFVGGLGRRFVASLLDSLVPGAAAGLVGGLLGGADGSAQTIGVVIGVLVALAWGVLCWWLLALRAATPGMRLMKLQLVGFLDGRPVGFGRALLRWLVWTLASATGIGLLLLLVFLLVHPRHQGWHDLVANGVVIRERPLAPPRPVTSVAPEVADEAVDQSRPQHALSGASSSAPPAAAAASGPVAAAMHPGASGRPSGSPTGPLPSERSILEGWVAELDDGREVLVTGLVLLGRNPQPAAGEEDAQLIKLADQTRTVSKTHLAIGVDDAGPFVVDRGSTNGSTVTMPDRVSTACAPHTAVGVAEGAIVSIGDHWLRIRRDEV